MFNLVLIKALLFLEVSLFVNIVWLFLEDKWYKAVSQLHPNFGLPLVSLSSFVLCWIVMEKCCGLFMQNSVKNKILFQANYIILNSLSHQFIFIMVSLEGQEGNKKNKELLKM